MDFSQQLPIVIHSLNIGFLQTLRLFVITLIGACPLGLAICFGSMSRIKPVSAFFKLLIWVVRGTPLMIQLLIIYFFPGLVLHNPIWGGGETGRCPEFYSGETLRLGHDLRLLSAVKRS
mgnify:CR=1 FL=1